VWPPSPPPPQMAAEIAQGPFPGAPAPALVLPPGPDQLFYKPAVRCPDGALRTDPSSPHVFEVGATLRELGTPVVGVRGFHAVDEFLSIIGLGFKKGDMVLEVRLGPDTVTNGQWAASMELTVTRVLPDAEVTARALGVQCITKRDGTQEWFLDAVLHREDDLPASVSANGDLKWTKMGALHRVGGPALVTKDSESWYEEGLLHRTGGEPAVVNKATKTKQWYVRGKLHRDGDKPAIKVGKLQKEWYVNDTRHREGGPALVMADGLKVWYKDGKIHRGDDLPAKECANGDLEWFRKGLRHRGGDKPAVVRADGQMSWHVKGKMHRVGKPAIIGPGTKTEFWLDGLRSDRGSAMW